MQLFRKALVFMAFIYMLSNASYAQNLLYDIEFETYFDNRENSGAENFKSRSGSEFASFVAPSLALELNPQNRLYFGIQAYVPFEEADDSLFEDVQAVLYYAYNGDNWSATAGIFPRHRMAIDSYSTAFFADDYLFYDRLIGGVMGQYRVGESFVEFVCDWESQPSESSRERFRLLSAARKYWSTFYVGYNLSVTHFAGQEREGFDNVVDNALVNPRVGARIKGKYDFDISMSYLQSLQRDRSYENVWLTPSMGEAAIKVSRWGVTLSEQLFFGDDLMPLYGGHTLEDGTQMEYGSLLYTGDPFFSTDGGYYNRAAVSYNRDFFDGVLSLRAEFVANADKSGMGTEQILSVKVNIGGGLYRSKKSE